MENRGWFKLYRDLKPVVIKDPDHLAVFIYLLSEAQFKDGKTMFGKKEIILKRGQLIIGREKIVKYYGGKNKLSSSKVQRVLKNLENEQVIEQLTTPYGRLITVINYEYYQDGEQQSGQRVNNEWTTSEQRVNTIKELKNIKKEKKEEDLTTYEGVFENTEKGEMIPYKEIVEYLNEKTGLNLRHTTNKTRDLIKARWNEGFRLDDFKSAIDNAVKFRTKPNGEIDTRYLMPKTIFNGSFETRVLGTTYKSKSKEMEKEEQVDILKGRYDHLITRD